MDSRPNGSKDGPKCVSGTLREPDLSSVEARAIGRLAYTAAMAVLVGLLSSVSVRAFAQIPAEAPSVGLQRIIPAAAGAATPKGLTPTPAYLLGTTIPLEEVLQGNASAVGAAGSARPDNAWGGWLTAGSEVGSTLLATAPAPDLQGNHRVWQKLLPFLPEPGNFAVIPGSELAPVLVHNGEFDFCDQIKCHRSASVLGAWNGGAFDHVLGEFRLHGGGHADYGGNEVYVFDFSTLRWTRETDPQPLSGPFLRDTDGDGTADACPAPAAGPPATHTYQGFLYVPKIDRYWLFGTVEYCRNGMGGSSAWEYDAHKKSWTAMPDLDQFARFARAVIDPESGNVLARGGRKNGWVEIDPATRQTVRSFKNDPFGSYIDGSAVFDPQRRVVYAVIGGRDKDRLVAYDWPAAGQSDGLLGRLIAEWPKDARKVWGMARHSSGLLVLWDGNSRITLVDPDSGKSWEEKAGGYRYVSMGGADRAGKVYSKWVYIPEVDAFFGITNPDMGVVLYRLGRQAADYRQLPSETETSDELGSVDRVEGVPTGQGASLPSSSEPPAVTSNQIVTALGDNAQDIPLEIESRASWDEVCATAVLCDPMGEGDVIYRGRVVESGAPEMRKHWRNISQKFSHPDARAPEFDPQVGGLRFTFPSNSLSGAAGNFKTNFSPDYSFQIGPAEAGAPAQEAYIQFQVRYSCTFIWKDCDPQSSNYRKERRCFLSKQGDGRCTASKIALISTGDREGFAADACTNIQTAINHGADHILAAFHRCPITRGFSEGLESVGGRAQRNSQPNGVYDCPRILDDRSGRGWNNTADSCFRLIDERWITIQIHLRFGPWQAKPKKKDPKLSHVSIWAAIEGENGDRQRMVIANDFAAAAPEHSNDFVGKIWLMPHLYDKTSNEEHPPFYVWYRNLVISESPIPNPN